MPDTATVARPGMRPYKARKPPVARYWIDDDGHLPIYGITAYRTHDLNAAFILASEELRVHGEPGDRLSAPEPTWMRRSPDPGDPKWYRVEPSKRGAVPCVIYLIEETT